jgi:hypothetical protein
MENRDISPQRIGHKPARNLTRLPLTEDPDGGGAGGKNARAVNHKPQAVHISTAIKNKASKEKKGETGIMDTKTLYHGEGYMGNEEQLLKILKSECPKLADTPNDKLKQILENNLKKENIVYFGTNYTSISDGIGAEYKWLPTGFKNSVGIPLFIQFFKGDYQWIGGLVGTPDKIVGFRIKQVDKPKAKKEMQRNLELWKVKNGFTGTVNKTETADPEAKTEPVEPDKANTEPSGEKMSDKPSVQQAPVQQNAVSGDTLLDSEKPFYNGFYNKLLVKAGWTPELIKNYLYTMVKRENFLLSVGRGKEYIIRSKVCDGKTYSLLNTALLNNLGFPIKLIVEEKTSGNEISLGYDARFWTVCESKEKALRFGFAKEDMSVELPPVVYYEHDPNELVFSADLEDFDLENEGRLSHCIDRKLERDVDGINSLSPNQIYASMVQAIRTAVTISKYDKSFVKPIYNRGKNEINFVIPYHANGRFDRTPELGILIAKGDYGLWQAMTVLDYESVIKDCNCLAPYRASTFWN